MIVLGLAFADSTPHAPLFHASLAYRRGDFILTGRLTRGSESFWDIDLLSLIGLEELAIDEIEDRPTRGIWELGVMGGICLGRPRTFLTLSAGLGWVHHIDRGRHIGRECVGSYSGSTADCYEQYESVTASSLGLALEANLIVSTSDLAGIGVNIFVNLNDTLPFYGAGVALYSGLVPAP
jgi:hypothetical protein